MTAREETTVSLCPYCLRRIPARHHTEDGRVYLIKRCPEHGDIPRVLIWNNHRLPLEKWHRRRVDSNESSHILINESSREGGKTEGKGCPSECGICRNHKQHTCSAIVEVTERCNLHCPVCFADSPRTRKSEPSLAGIEAVLRKTLEDAGACPLQISGGEPTLRDDLPEIVALARRLGFNHVQINTNGIRIAHDPGFIQALKDAGMTDFFLQFDGLDDNTYLQLRGTSLLHTKLKAVEICAEMKIAVILVPTLVKGLNHNQLGGIIQFAKQWMPAVKGVHFQPMTYLGRYPDDPQNEQRLLIPDILTAIEEQTAGEFSVENFIPPG